MKPLLRLIILGVFFARPAMAQSQPAKQPITVDEAIKAAVQHNETLKQAALDEEIASVRYKQTEAFYLPQAGLSARYTGTNNPLNAFGLKLQQKGITAADFNPSLLNDPGARGDFSTLLEVRQPIFNADLNYQRKAAAGQLDMIRLQSKRSQEYIAYATQMAFLQLQMSLRAEKVIREALITAKAILKKSEDYFNQGVIQKSDLLNAQVFVSNTETSIETAKSNIEAASDQLSLLMGKPTGIIYMVNDEIKPVANTDTLTLTDNRADFAAMNKGMQVYDLMIKSAKKSYLPRLNAFANYQLNDKQVMGFGAGAWLAGVQLSWDIFKGNQTKNQIAVLHLEKQKLGSQLQQQKEDARSGINQAKRKLNESIFRLRQETTAGAQAAEALRVLQNRYDQGLATTSDVLVAQTQLSRQQLNYVQALFEQNTAALTLQFLTKTDQP